MKSLVFEQFFTAMLWDWACNYFEKEPASVYFDDKLT